MNITIISLTLAMIFFAYLVIKVVAKSPNPKIADTILTLALFASGGLLLATGSIEMAGRYGYSMIISLFAFALVFVIAPLVLFPIRRLSTVVRLSTSVDFLTFRYRGRGVAIAASLMLTAAVIPLLLSQIIAMQSAMQQFLEKDLQLLTLFITLILIGVISRKAIQADNSDFLRKILASSGLLLLFALGFSGWVAVDSAFGGITAMDDWVLKSGQQTVIKRFDAPYSLFIVFLAAGLSFPTNFNTLVAETISDKQADMLSWSYPFLLLLACIPLLPILWSGLHLKAPFPMQEYIFSLPLLTGNPLISSLGLASVISLSTAISASLCITCARMLMNSIILPNKNFAQQLNLSDWLKSIHFLVAIGLIFLCVAISISLKSRSIIDLCLVGFSGLAQLTPGLIAAMYLPKVNRYGFMVGILSGMSLWFFALVIPLFIGDWSWEVPLIEKSLLFGMQAWEVWSIEALILNITLCLLFSVFQRMDAQQRKYASICMADNIYIPILVDSTEKNTSEIIQKLRTLIGSEADLEVSAALDKLGFSLSDTRPAAIRRIRSTINASLNLRFGVLAAERIMNQALPLPKMSGSEQKDLTFLESVLAVQTDQLTGIASELNKLRVHHREILNKLPIGIISIGKNREILRWNLSMSKYTGIDKNLAYGSLITELPNPWNFQIDTFFSSEDNSWDKVQLDLNGCIRWFSFQKSIDISLEETTEEVILLIEDQTESVILIQKSINNERLASVGRLAAGVAHEIGNPVTGIACIAQNLEHETELGQLNTSAQQILSQTARINRIVDSLINFSRGENATQRPLVSVNLSEVTQEAIDLLLMSATCTRVQFIASIADDLEIIGDYHQLIQIFLNLLSNSRDASTENSKVTIIASKSVGGIKVTVNDSGSGIDEDIRNQLFEPFVTSKDPGEGTGLGLWVVFNLIKRLDAEISIITPAENNDCGTTVSMLFQNSEGTDIG